MGRTLRKSFSETQGRPLKVFCDADPLDVRPALDILVPEIASRSRNKPLIVLMGELHPMPTHKALRQGLMTRLLGTTSSFAYGVECPHNFIERFAIDAGLDIPAALRGTLSENDRTSRLFLDAMQGYRFAAAPESAANLMRFCRENAIAVRPNDAARRGPYFDLDDPRTRMLLSGYERQDLASLRRDSCHGVDLRNRMMVEGALRHMAETGSRIYIQQSGSAHLFGNLCPKHFKKSLSVLFAKAGFDVLPVFLSTRASGVKSLPAPAHALLRQGLVIQGLSAEEFRDTSSGEEDFIQRINRHSGGETPFIPRRDTDHGVDFERPVFQTLSRRVAAMRAAL